MTKLVTLTIDGKQVIAEQGTLVVDAAKNAGIDIPVLCYHPKMEPVGMCRMCLVEIGRPLRDRKTGELVLEEDGSPKIQFGRNLETACTTPVSEGMIVNGLSEKVREARKEVLEFLLTSHPLDCPVCDKGGECALQNLTLEYGPVTSRFKFDDKIHFQKHIPLSDLIFLDRERCILCGRCIRFQDEIVGDPVIAFDHRGRSTEVFTNSDPGFDSYWSGNTTDLCPVGALTTADFRFGSRPWELNYTASLSPHSPVGANLSINVRREAKSNGQIVIKRIMPRQNEWVNEIWISDKDRFGYHFYESEERLLKPLVRENGELKETSWENALDKAAQAIKDHREGLLTLVSGRLSNEDLFNAAQITKDVGGKTALYTNMAGGDLVSQVGLPPDSNFKELGAGTTILVIASDLEEEAPIWWLRTKQASERGATLIVANPRPTKLDRYADFTLRYAYGEEAAIVESLMDSQSDAAKAFTQAENAVVIFGSEGTGLESSTVLATACADLLLKTNHVGRPNNGLIGVWQRPNTQGAWDMGFRPVADLAGSIKAANILYIIAADPLGDNPALKQSLQEADFVIVQELFLTETAKLADIVLPAQTLFEREGTFTSGERRVQRFYPAVSPRGETLADFDISSKLGVKLGLDLPGQFPSLVMPRICETFPAYQGITYQKLAQVIKQNPIIGREDLYYGGTSYENKQGLGLQLPLSETNNESTKAPIDLPQKIEVPEGSLLAVPVTRLYDRGQLITKSEILQAHIPEPYLALNPEDAERLNITDGVEVTVSLQEGLILKVSLNETVPVGVALIPRSMGIPINKPIVTTVKLAQAVVT